MALCMALAGATMVLRALYSTSTRSGAHCSGRGPAAPPPIAPRYAALGAGASSHRNDIPASLLHWPTWLLFRSLSQPPSSGNLALTGGPGRNLHLNWCAVLQIISPGVIGPGQLVRSTRTASTAYEYEYGAVSIEPRTFREA